jgi:hypothetical protein
MFKELRKDTAAINSTIRKIEFITGKLDTFCLLSSKYPGNVNNGQLYYYARYCTWVEFYASDNTTMGQLKSSGNLRLMPDEISQAINEYGKDLAELQNEYELTKAEFIKIEELYFSIFDENIGPNINNPSEISRDSVFSLNPPLIDPDPKKMKVFASWLRFELNIYREQVRTQLIPLKEKAKGVLALLKDKYHL